MTVLKLKVAEIVDTVEGEAMCSGMPVTYISTPGCLNNCPFCKWLPTKSESEETTLQAVVQSAKNTSNILLGCGECLLQGQPALDFALLLNTAVRTVIQTGGHKRLQPLLNKLLNLNLRPGLLFHLRPGISNLDLLKKLNPEIDAIKLVPTDLNYFWEGVDIIKHYKPSVWTHIMPYKKEPQKSPLRAYFQEYLLLGPSVFDLKIRMGLLLHMHVGIR